MGIGLAARGICLRKQKVMGKNGIFEKIMKCVYQMKLLAFWVTFRKQQSIFCKEKTHFAKK